MARFDARWRTRLLLDRGLQARQPFRELAANHLVQIEKGSYELVREGAAAGHRPSHSCRCTALGQGKLGNVMGDERIPSSMLNGSGVAIL